MTKRINLDKDWKQLGNSGDVIILQNVGSYPIEVKIGKESTDGFIIYPNESFSYTFGEPVFARSIVHNGVIVFDAYSTNIDNNSSDSSSKNIK